jgi:hypothetical protein
MQIDEGVELGVEMHTAVAANQCGRLVAGVSCHSLN